MCKTNLPCLGVAFKHWKIIDIAKTVCILFTQIKLLAKLYAKLSRIVVSTLLLVRDKENGIARFQPRKRCKLRFEPVRNKLVNRPLVSPVRRNFKISKTAHSHTRRKVQQLFVEAL